MPLERTTVLVADDHPVFRDGLNARAAQPARVRRRRRGPRRPRGAGDDPRARSRRSPCSTSRCRASTAPRWRSRCAATATRPASCSSPRTRPATSCTARSPSAPRPTSPRRPAARRSATPSRRWRAARPASRPRSSPSSSARSRCAPSRTARAVAARARGPGAHRRRPVGAGHRQAALPQPGDGQDPPAVAVREARRLGPRRGRGHRDATRPARVSLPAAEIAAEGRCDGARVGLALVDADGRYLYVNERARGHARRRRRGAHRAHDPRRDAGARRTGRGA